MSQAARPDPTRAMPGARFLQRIASSESPGTLVTSWLACLAYCAFSVFLFYMFAFHARSLAPTLIAGFFVAFGAVYLWLAVQKTLEYFRFGAVTLRLEGAPPVLGGELVARLLWPAEGVRALRVELSATETTTETDARGRSARRARVRWREERTVPVAGGAPLLHLSVPDAPQVERGVDYEWKLRVRAELPGVDFDRTYPIGMSQPPPGSTPPPAPPAQAIAPEPAAPEAVAPAPAVAAPLLIAANAVPLLGVLAWDWRVGDIVVLYWIENLVIGLFNVLRILAAQPAGGGAALLPGKLFLAGFFLVHYGAFCAAHGVFLAAMFPPPGAGAARPGIDGVVMDMLREPGLVAAVAALTLSHGYSFVRNYLGREEYRHVNLGQLMHRPYARIVVVHIFIIAGGFLVEALRLPAAALVLFVALKIAIDLGMHRRERALLARPRAAR